MCGERGRFLSFGLAAAPSPVISSERGEWRNLVSKTSRLRLELRVFQQVYLVPFAAAPSLPFLPVRLRETRNEGQVISVFL